MLIQLLFSSFLHTLFIPNQLSASNPVDSGLDVATEYVKTAESAVKKRLARDMTSCFEHQLTEIQFLLNEAFEKHAEVEVPSIVASVMQESFWFKGKQQGFVLNGVENGKYDYKIDLEKLEHNIAGIKFYGPDGEVAPSSSDKRNISNNSVLHFEKNGKLIYEFLERNPLSRFKGSWKKSTGTYKLVLHPYITGEMIGVEIEIDGHISNYHLVRGEAISGDRWSGSPNWSLQGFGLTTFVDFPNECASL